MEFKMLKLLSQTSRFMLGVNAESAAKNQELCDRIALQALRSHQTWQGKFGGSTCEPCDRNTGNGAVAQWIPKQILFQNSQLCQR
ncbi:Hypothetical predicted protein [Olea europaea subsp. europaea]|uniref:Uncharacterized protein n=1 Tax=Olea europaea subsp. europaea TaxID=158383 RepID=A0A8S0T2X4_OLEEU|nr:Hypothetical predicted protein [Olea europaea subsp. europaea]